MVLSLRKNFLPFLISIIFIGLFPIFQDKSNAISTSMFYPSDVVTDKDFLEYAYRSQELLRIEHNYYGFLYRNGTISENEWKNYLTDEFNPRSTMITNEILKYRDKVFLSDLKTNEIDALSKPTTDYIEEAKSTFKSSTRWEINVGTFLIR